MPDNPLNTDYFLGGVSNVPKEIRRQDGQWDDFLPVDEFQSDDDLETMACVTFSATNTLEIMAKEKYGADLNLSDRFTAKMSGTSRNGNGLQQVWDSLRNNGFVQENEWPWDRLKVNTWEDYYRPIPAEIVSSGLKSLEKWEVMYEWVFYDSSMTVSNLENKRLWLKEALKMAPIQVTIRFSSAEDRNGIIHAVPGAVQHAVTVYGYVEGQYWKVFDHYSKTHKLLAWDYYFGHALRGFIRRKTNIDTAMLKSLEGKYVQRVDVKNGGKGQIYKVVKGSLIFFDSNKDASLHIPLVDELLRDLGEQKKLIGITEADFNKLSDK